MGSAKRVRKRAASRKRKTQVLSTSQARAHFAKALETAQADNAVIGFDRYGRTVAALVPVEAIYMLAGLGHLVPAATRKAIENGAALFARNAPPPPPRTRKTKPAPKAAKKSAGGRKRRGA